MTHPNPAHEAELERIRAVYRERAALDDERYGLAKAANLFLRHGQERELQRILAQAGLIPLSGKRILDVGCGTGIWLGFLERLGAEPRDLHGLDLDEVRIEVGRERLPAADLRTGDASQLPWGDATFDLVTQFTVFTSVLDTELRKRIACEMLRVLRPGGAIVWYDFLYNNPSNPDVRGLKLSEIRALFPQCEIESRRVTLAPPLARRLVSVSWTVGTVLERMRLLNTHYLAVIRPRGLKARGGGVRS